MKTLFERSSVVGTLALIATILFAGPVFAQVDLEVTAEDSPDPVVAGSGVGNLTHVLTVTNNGPSQASGVELAIAPVIPAGVSIIDVDADIGTWDGDNLFLDIGDHPVGVTATLTITLTVDNTASACTDCISATGTASANETDTTPGNNTAVDPTSIEVAEGAPTTFLTTVDFTNGFEGTVTAMISCNNGSPLEQSFDISPGLPVDFVVTELDFVGPGIGCTISLGSLGDGYIASALANGVATGGVCIYSSEPEAGEAPFNDTLDRDNTCSFALVPVGFVYTINKVWGGIGGDLGHEIEDLEYELMGTCFNVRPDADSEVNLSEASFDCNKVGASDTSCSSPLWYADPDGGTYCTGAEEIDDNSVDTDNGCASQTLFVVGRTSGSCTIVNTVFFEGIPTLSQYGLAIMALLMLGVGFVGFRRFI